MLTGPISVLGLAFSFNNIQPPKWKHNLHTALMSYVWIITSVQLHQQLLRLDQQSCPDWNTKCSSLQQTKAYVWPFRSKSYSCDSVPAKCNMLFAPSVTGPFYFGTKCFTNIDWSTSGWHRDLRGRWVINWLSFTCVRLFGNLQTCTSLSD